jgi:hypothetical protein
MQIKQPVGILSGRDSGVNAGTHRMTNVHAQPNSLVQVLDFLDDAGRRRIYFIRRPVIVNGHFDIVLLDFLID